MVGLVPLVGTPQSTQRVGSSQGPDGRLGPAPLPKRHAPTHDPPPPLPILLVERGVDMAQPIARTRHRTGMESRHQGGLHPGPQTAPRLRFRTFHQTRMGPLDHSWILARVLQRPGGRSGLGAFGSRGCRLRAFPGDRRPVLEAGVSRTGNVSLRPCPVAATFKECRAPPSSNRSAWPTSKPRACRLPRSCDLR